MDVLSDDDYDPLVGNADFDASPPPGSPGDMMLEEPTIVPRPADLHRHDVYEGQRFETLTDADDAIALCFNRQRRKLRRVRQCKLKSGARLAYYACATELTDGADEPKCAWKCVVRHDPEEAERWSHDAEQVDAGFVFLKLLVADHHDHCLALPDDHARRGAPRQNIRVTSLPQFVHDHFASHLHTIKIAGVRAALKAAIYADPGVSAAQRVFNACIVRFIGHPVTSYWKLHSW